MILPLLNERELIWREHSFDLLQSGAMDLTGLVVSLLIGQRGIVRDGFSLIKLRHQDGSDLILLALAEMKPFGHHL